MFHITQNIDVPPKVSRLFFLGAFLFAGLYDTRLKVLDYHVCSIRCAFAGWTTPLLLHSTGTTLYAALPSDVRGRGGGEIIASILLLG